MGTVTLSTEQAEALARSAFIKCGAAPESAEATAQALVSAEADGQKGHGLARIPSYCGQLRSGKVNGAAKPAMSEISAAAIAVDAGFGFAYPALDLAIEEIVPRTKSLGIACAVIRRSHHFGQAGAQVEKLAAHGLVGLLFGNSPKAVAFWGSAAPALGTNPIAFAAPLPNGPPLVIDLALSVAARGKIIAAEKNGEAIPEGWALDAEGRPTTEPSAALKGSMIPLGGAKGAALVLMVEILAAALTGSHFGFEASSLFTEEGEAPNLGQALIAIDPVKLSGGAYPERMGVLLQAMAEAEGARLPGISRLANREAAKKNGLSISESLYAEITALAGGAGDGRP